MATHKKRLVSEDSLEDLSIMEAVENLSHIAELEDADTLEITEDHQILLQKAGQDAKTSWLGAHNRRETEEAVRETFRSVLYYLKDFYQKEHTRFYEEKNQEGMRKIMLLVGEASEKLNKYTSLFKDAQHLGIIDTKEYKQLDSFYKQRVAVEGGKRSLSQLSFENLTAQSQTTGFGIEEAISHKESNTILDVEDVKEDMDYELLFLKKENGNYFFNPSLLKDTRLVCQFGKDNLKQSQEDLLLRIKYWYDYSIHIAAKDTLENASDLLKEFFREAMKFKDVELISCMAKASMALMLAANTKNMVQNNPKKSCHLYYRDFVNYIREAIQCEEYGKLINDPPPQSQRLLYSVMGLLQVYYQSLFEHGLTSQNLDQLVNDLVEEGIATYARDKKDAFKKEKISHFWKQLEFDYNIITQTLQNYPNGPIYKVFELLRSDYEEVFDNIVQDNFPNELYILDNVIDKSVNFIRLPSPTRQESVQKVVVIDEFKAWIEVHAMENTTKKHLIVNLQDRNLWREYNRCNTLEQMQKRVPFDENLSVITLATQTDFYKQINESENISDAEQFYKQFKEELGSEACGFFFPDAMKKQLLSTEYALLFNQVHKHFFFSKKSLTKEDRRCFIDIFYYLLLLRLIALYQFDFISFTCKDGVDISEPMAAGFFSFIKLLKKESLSKVDRNHLYMMLFATPLYVRERLIRRESFMRFIHTIEYVQHRTDEFSKDACIDAMNHMLEPIIETDLSHWKIQHASSLKKL